ncbi:MAG: hypothetical protein WDO14_04185 [Bacteroidota bacterium]
MKKIVLVILIALSACQHDEPKTNCDVDDPINNVPWLKQKVQEIESSQSRQAYTVYKVKYNGETGFYISFCCAACNMIVLFYHCDGTSTPVSDFSQMETIATLWKPEDYKCLY